jgi:predicted amidohydrolase
VAALRVTLVQQPLVWQQALENRRHLGELLRPLAGHTDLVVLPETFTTGFSMEVEALAEPEGGASTQWLRELARTLDAAVTGSLISAAGGRFYNRLVWAQPDGGLRCYDKRHLFRMGREHEHFTAGRGALSLSWRGFSICPLVCYDLRFPVFSRRRPELDYDVLVYVANWPAARARLGSSCCGRAPSRTRRTCSASIASAWTVWASPMPATARRSIFWGGPWYRAVRRRRCSPPLWKPARLPRSAPASLPTWMRTALPWSLR